ncbi:unnamed protein product [Rhizopus stolonifer]
MRTLHGHQIVEFETHLKRLRHSFLMMNWQPYQPKLDFFQDTEKLKEKILPLLKQGLEVYDHTSEAKVSILISYCFKKEQPILAAHFSPLVSIESNVKVMVSHRSRKSPTVKDSRWVEERQELEENKPPEINEVLLVHEDQVYEGMSSNFLAIKIVNQKPVLICAGLEHVLLGTILKIVMTICEKENIEIVWDFPRLKEANEWEGCFITSTSRLLLPVETIYNGSERIEFKRSKTIEFLRQRVIQEILNTAYPL